jgi:hypothetical protein
MSTSSEHSLVRVSMALAEDEPAASPQVAAPCANVLPPSFVAKPGAEVFSGVYLGRSLGRGVQVSAHGRNSSPPPAAAARRHPRRRLASPRHHRPRPRAGRGFRALPEGRHQRGQGPQDGPQHGPARLPRGGRRVDDEPRKGALRARARRSGSLGQRRALASGSGPPEPRPSLPTIAAPPRRAAQEWELGMQLKAALELPDGSLPGFTRTCDCTVMIGDGKRATAHFQGMVMEQINGARGRAARGREGRAPAAARRAPPSCRRPPHSPRAAARRLGCRPPSRGPRLPQHPLRARDALPGPLRARPRAARGGVRTEPAGSLAWPVGRLEWAPNPTH